MPEDHKNITREKEHGSSQDSPAFKTEQLQKFVTILTDNFHEAIQVKSRHAWKAFLPGQDLTGRDLKTYESWLAKAHNYYREVSHQNGSLTYVSEWLLDNYYIIRQSMGQIKEDLPPTYYWQLPRLIKGPSKDSPRIYALACAVLSYQHLLLDPIDLQTILIQYQERVSLTMGELWALPTFLRYSLIESLAQTLVSTIHPANPPDLPASFTYMSEIINTFYSSENEPGDTGNNDVVANIILSLRAITELDWSEFYESVSVLEHTLRLDPAGIYSKMDFKTRDLYRKEIESISFATGLEECELAEIIIDLARANPSEHPTLLQESITSHSLKFGDKSAEISESPDFVSEHGATCHFTHIGEYLIGKKRDVFEKRIGYHPDFKSSVNRWVLKHASRVYFSGILLISILTLVVLFLVVQLPKILSVFPLIIGGSPWDSMQYSLGIPLLSIAVFLIAITVLIPVITIATSLMNWLITLKMKPNILPKLYFKGEIPENFQTLIVIPTMITNREEVDSLANQLELHYLRNPERGLLFALLTDFSDADSETLPEDEDLVQYATAVIEQLNTKYNAHSSRIFNDRGSETGQEENLYQTESPLFYFLHRKRLWNPSEKKWIGWERKRGKLHELNQLLRGEKGLSFTNLSDEVQSEYGPLQHVRFVITLDTDTILPRGAARRLIGALAHPLNRAVFDSKTNQVISGYTVLQPRMEIHPKSANRSLFTRLFAGDAGLDLYTLAVSDAYQDLFGEGIYVGKGIYDVDAFEHSVANRIPENTILSHDLLEGLMGRAGLVSDITMIEDYPQNYFLQVIRQRRWIRGDWQLLPWLLQYKKYGLVFSAIDLWKMIDNLRRAMLAPVLLIIFMLGLTFLPEMAALWTTIVLISLAVPMLTGIARGAMQIIEGEIPKIALRPMRWNIQRWLLAISFLPYEAYTAADAIFTTLFRLLISHKDLLQWTTAAQTTHMFGLQARRKDAWQKMGAFTLLAILLISVVQLTSDLTRTGIAPALIYAAPVLLLWIISPSLAWWINRPIAKTTRLLNEEEENLLRQVTRRTWGFFERFVGPEDHWLPPDHYQESPVGTIAHHTSPTNIGLLLTSTLAAYDLGYLDQLGLVTRLFTTMDSLDRLERFRGHFMNWYDTLTLQPLQPRYISTVDSGNLAASLIITTQACKTMVNEPIFRWGLWQGYLDTLSNLTEILTEIRKAEFTQQVEVINTRINEMHAEILAARTQPQHWYPLFLKAIGPFWHYLSNHLMELVEVGRSAFDLKTLEKLQEVTGQVERHHNAVLRTIDELVPWIPLLENPPARFIQPEFINILADLTTALPYNLVLGQVHTNIKAASPYIDSLRNLLTENDPDFEHFKEPSESQKAGLEWLQNLSRALAHSSDNSDSLITRFAQIMTRCEQYVDEMDFGFLYHLKRRVFHIGYNLDSGSLDQNYYDLLASEARIASIIAIAKRDVPQSHWLHLGRPVRRVEDSYVLLSWSGTMFEYLMPSMFLRSYPGTLLEESVQGAVLHQIAYGKAKGVPWGISESGFYQFDANQNYQYRAFGVPGLGFKRGLGDDLVIAPYASLMAVKYAPQAVVSNLNDLINHKMIGLYGAYESIDFTTDRLLLDQSSAIVSEYMVHHQGMVLMAMDNFFHDDIMVRRMHNDSRIQSVNLLLQEQIPHSAPPLDPYAEDVKGIRRIAPTPVDIIPWSVPVQTPIPQVHLLSNGNYNVLISNMGAGYSSWRETDLTRWRPDSVLDSWGNWIYIQEINDKGPEKNKIWSASHQPVPGDMANMKVTYFAHKAVFHRMENGIDSTMEVTVAPDDPVEIRRIHLHNNNHHPLNLRLTSYGEVILTSQAADARHPAFNKLFIESEFIPELNLQIFMRRPRSNKETTIFMGHMLFIDGNQIIASHEADRNRFIGRNRTMQNPAGLNSQQYLSGTTGATLDPIFALGQEIRVNPHESSDLAFMTFAAQSREEIITLARRYSRWTMIDRSFDQANIVAHTWLSKQDMTTMVLKDTLQVLSALLYAFKLVRTSPETIASNRLGQPGLWRFGISGDYPILLVELHHPEQIDLVREALQVHKFLHTRRFKMDVVILNCQQTNYGAELHGLIYRLVSKMGSEVHLNQRGGIYILYADQMEAPERTLLFTAARVLIKGENGSLNNQLPSYSMPVHHLPEFISIRPVIESVYTSLNSKANPLEEEENLQFYNGYGGFSADGSEYVIELPTGRHTPVPWVNVIGYPEFGFMVSESGSQCTWALNSGENRLTPWSNDPVRDPTGEVLYLRDEETGEVWTPTPLPSGTTQPYRVTHGAGYTIFDHNSHGLIQRLTLFASPEDPVKIIHLKVENTLNYARRITATQYVEWVLGTTRTAGLAYIIPEYDSTQECLLASNPYNSEFGSRTAFLIANKAVHGLTADRTEFLGRAGTYKFPAALHRLGLETRITPGEDPCAVLQLHIDLHPGESEEIYFVLGQGKDKEHALALARKYHKIAMVDAAFERTHVFWDHLLQTIQVHTPEPAIDLILNRWMLYQTLSCRLWGRTAFYQSSGAFGFRDQLQDVLALLPIDPSITRNQILNAASHQFEEGDVMHWWHPPAGRGVRTRISDNLLWLPYATALYIEATGDMSFLDEKIPFRHAAPLSQGEDERYQEFPLSEQQRSLMDHCRRAIEKGATTGPHGLPLIGTGDWNDGLNNVGENGQGESIWLAWFLCDVLNRFAVICEQYGDSETAQNYKSRSKEYAAAVELTSWDGEWYRRAYYDDGAALGSSQNKESQIDAIAQSWAVLSGAGDPQRSRQAMQSVLDRLVHPQNRLLLLFTPPFDKTPHDPGYIKGYLPGIRENGGQYTHAATWTAWAFAQLGDGKKAGELFDLLNPVFQSDTEEKAAVYRVEPYVVCADIYSTDPYIRRGGWTWYTGSASWMYRLGLEAILGFHKIGDTLHIDPVIPPAWDRYEITYQYKDSVYQIQVENPGHVARNVLTIELDGKILEDGFIHLSDDKQEHQVIVILGNKEE